MKNKTCTSNKDIEEEKGKTRLLAPRSAKNYKNARYIREVKTPRTRS